MTTNTLSLLLAVITLSVTQPEAALAQRKPTSGQSFVKPDSKAKLSRYLQKKRWSIDGKYTWDFHPEDKVLETFSGKEGVLPWSVLAVDQIKVAAHTLTIIVIDENTWTATSDIGKHVSTITLIGPAPRLKGK